MGGRVSLGICGTSLLEVPGQHLLPVLLSIPLNYLPWTPIQCFEKPKRKGQSIVAIV